MNLSCCCYCRVFGQTINKTGGLYMPLRIVWMCWWTLIVIVYIFLYSTVCCACICIEHLSHRLMLTNNQSAAAVRSTKDRKRDTDMSSGLVYPLRCVIGADMQHATCAFFFYYWQNHNRTLYTDVISFYILHLTQSIHCRRRRLLVNFFLFIFIPVARTTLHTWRQQQDRSSHQ